ncbi:MAG TPA: hypothetical protein VKC56_06515 [Gallionellaceae bacterium]|nr:hypothetical protein [Gallionellaceae bacterium]
MAINNDKDFKDALGKLSRERQRRVGALFAERVLALSHDDKVRIAVQAARRADASETELGAALQAAQAASVDSYTQCGHECNWDTQAGHFVAESVLASINPPDGGANAAWEAAMHARMARTCEAISAGRGTDNAEPGAQYRILEDFLNS